MNSIASQKDNTPLSANLLAALTTTDNQFDPTPAAPGVVNIDQVNDNFGARTGPVNDGGITDDLTPTLSGYVGPEGTGLTILFFANTKPIGSAVVNEQGSWTFTPEQPLEVNQQYFFQTVIPDPGGSNNLLISLPHVIYTIDANGDVPPSISLDNVTDNVAGGVNGYLSNGDLTNDSTPELAGKAAAGATISVYDNGQFIGSTTASTDGTWSFTPETALKDGVHNLTVSAANAMGETDPTAPFTLTLDSVINTPVITNIEDNIGIQTGNVENGGKTDDGQVAISGTAEAGSTVTVYVLGPNGRNYTLGEVTTNAQGQWSYQMSGTQNIGNLAGDWVFTAKATDAAGNTSDLSNGYTVNSVGSNQDDSVAPDAPVIDWALNNDGGDIPLQSGDTTIGTTPHMVGLAEANSLVTIYVDGHMIGTTTAAGNGIWRFTSPVQENGMHTFTATATDAAGNVSSSSAGFVINIEAISSGIEFFGDAANETHQTFTTDSGITVTAEGGRLFSQKLPPGITDGFDQQSHLYFYDVSSVHIALPGVANEVTVSWSSMSDDITFYDAQGQVISATLIERHDSPGGAGLNLDTYVAADGQHIASFTLNDVFFLSGVKWGASDGAAPQSLSLTNDGADGELMLSSLMSEGHDAAQADMANGAHDTLQLTLNDILGEAHDNLFVEDGHKQLAITGDAGDVIELQVTDIAHEWQDAGQVTAGGVQYEVYQHADLNVELLVQQGVELQQVS